jgi:precorrin-6B methylase 2
MASPKKLFFGGEGEIAENLRHEQRKVIKYNHLVANMVILHNVVGMSRVSEATPGRGGANQSGNTGWVGAISLGAHQSFSATTFWISGARSRRWMRGSAFWRSNQQAKANDH